MSTAATTEISTGTWAVDPSHSNVEFTVKHLGIATVRGRFREFEGRIEMGVDLASSEAYGKVKAASVDTNEVQRDEHLRSPDFCDVDKYPDTASSRRRSSWSTRPSTT